MIDRASVPMWGNARKSAGPAKWPGKNIYTRGDTRSGGTDPILATQRIPRGRDPIFSTQRIGAARIRFYLHKLTYPKKIFRCAGYITQEIL